MSESAFLRESLELFKRQRAKALDELRAIETTISQIQLQLGETPDLPNTEARENGGNAESPKTVYTPRPDEYFQMSQGDAARALLEKTGRAISLEDLVSGLKAGGCKVGGADPKRTLYISLVRNTRDFVPVQNGYIGLRKFYPNTSRAGRPSKSEALKAKAKKKTRTTKKGSHKAAPKIHKPAEPESAPESSVPASKRESVGATDLEGKPQRADIKGTLRKILGDNVARTLDDLTAVVQQRVGRPVKSFAVRGALESKDFEVFGDKYRIKQSHQEAAT